MPPVNDLLPGMSMGPLLEPGIMAGLACLWANHAQPISSPNEEQTAAQRRQKRARGDFMPNRLPRSWERCREHFVQLGRGPSEEERCPSVSKTKRVIACTMKAEFKQPDIVTIDGQTFGDVEMERVAI